MAAGVPKGGRNTKLLKNKCNQNAHSKKIACEHRAHPVLPKHLQLRALPLLLPKTAPQVLHPQQMGVRDGVQFRCQHFDPAINAHLLTAAQR